jgi:hypothetical protein
MFSLGTLITGNQAHEKNSYAKCKSTEMGLGGLFAGTANYNIGPITKNQIVITIEHSSSIILGTFNGFIKLKDQSNGTFFDFYSWVLDGSGYQKITSDTLYIPNKAIGSNGAVSFQLTHTPLSSLTVKTILIDN